MKKIPNKAFNSKVKPIAFYLPQFHPTPENNKWWGDGFTEWVNVSQSKPIFDGHYQPRIPGILGYYDLRLKETIEQQIALAQRYGIYGFCIYHYWFGGKKILHKPLEIFSQIETDFKFCLCWANESWSRRWDGSENELLIKQDHNFDTDKKYIEEIFPYLKKRNYIEAEGKKLLIIYRPSLIKDLKKLIYSWKEYCKNRGVDLAVFGCETFGESNLEKLGLDGSVEFPPHNTITPFEKSLISDSHPRKPIFYDYRKYVQDQVLRNEKRYKCFPGVITGWDNSPRRKISPTIFLNSTPSLFSVLLNDAIARSQSKYINENNRYIFINAWNEWAEGTYLEPDSKFGFEYLEVIQNLINTQGAIDLLLSRNGDASFSSDFMTALKAEILTTIFQRKKLLDYFPNMGEELSYEPTETIPEYLKNSRVSLGAFGNIDSINSTQINQIPVPYKKSMITLNGWFFNPDEDSKNSRRLVLVTLATRDKRLQYTWLSTGTFHNREDVSSAYNHYPSEVTLLSGYSLSINISNIKSNIYDVFIGSYKEGVISYVQCLSDFVID